MKLPLILLAALVVLVVAGLVLADYKWRQWMAARRRERENEPRERR